MAEFIDSCYKIKLRPIQSQQFIQYSFLSRMEKKKKKENKKKTVPVTREN